MGRHLAMVQDVVEGWLQVMKASATKTDDF